MRDKLTPLRRYLFGGKNAGHGDASGTMSNRHGVDETYAGVAGVAVGSRGAYCSDFLYVTSEVKAS